MKARVIRIALALTALFVVSGRAEAANICLTGATPAGGCTSTVATIDLALAAMAQGDVVYLDDDANGAGEYVGNWTLPVKTGTSGITIRTDCADSAFAVAGTRVSPLNASCLAVVRSNTSDPVFKTAAGAHHYTFIGVWAKHNSGGFNDVFRFGSNDCDAGFCQEFESQEPTDITLDRVMILGDPVKGQKRGVAVGGKNVKIINSYIAGMAGLGQDSQAINITNGHGPLLVENSYLEAAGYAFMSCGDDPFIRTAMTVAASPAATTSSATINVSNGPFGAPHSMAEVPVGAPLAIATGGGTRRYHTILRSKSGDGSSTIAITFDAIPAVPDSPGDIRTGVIPTGITFRRNHITKNLAWLNPIVNAPTNGSATASTAAGTLAAGTYQYTIVAQNTDGYNGNTVSSSPITVSATLNATGQIILTWAPSSNATRYRIWGRSSSVTMYWDVTAPTVTFTDTGSAGTASTTVASSSYWQIKNLFELKCGINVLLEGNVLEYSWNGADVGYMGWVKSVNQNLTAEWLQTKGVVYKNNWWRHGNGWLIIAGENFVNNQNDRVQPLTDFTAFNNLVTDCNGTWAVSRGGAAATAFALRIADHPVGVNIYRNTIDCTPRGLIQLDSWVDSVVGLRFADNMTRVNTSGVHGSGRAIGTDSINFYAPAAVFTNNTLAGGSSSQYPAGNFFPSTTLWEAQYKNYTPDGAPDVDGPADFALADSSLYLTSSTTGGPLGADIAAVLAATDGVTSGSAGSSQPPTITTTALANGTAGQAYSAQLTASCIGTCSWTQQSGSLPAALSLAGSGAITGTPSAAGTTTGLVFRVTDSATALTADTVSLSLTIDPAPAAIQIQTTSPLAAGEIGSTLTRTLTALNDGPTRKWAITGGALPGGVTLGETTGILAGEPTATGAFSFTAQVTGALGTVASRTFALTINPESMPACSAIASGRSRSVLGLVSGALFRQPIAPTFAVNCVRKGDLWIDTSLMVPILKVANGGSDPVTWSAVGGGASLHNILSATHSDTTAATLAAGDLLFVNENSKLTRLGLGSAGTVLTSDGAAPGWAQPTGGGGSSTRRTWNAWTAQQGIQPATGYAAFDIRNGHPVVDFTDGVTEAMYFEAVMPEEYDGSNLNVQIRWMSATAITGDVRWECSLEMMSTDLDSDSFGTAVLVTTPTNTTASGILTVSSCQLDTAAARDSVAAGTSYRVQIRRIGADAADTMTGAAQVLAVQVRK